ncbi:MAG: ribulose-phosphate 3-epimerase, partial [Chitinophagales bacterium]
PLSALEEILPYIDLVCLMSVNPGFGGQGFIATSLQKIIRLREMLKAGGYNVLIEVDGGVKLDNAQKILDAGADVLVSGSGVFSQPDTVAAIQSLKDLQRNNL